MALPKIHRLPSSEIKTVIRRGSFDVNELSTIRYIRRRQGASRFAVIVSKQVSKKSHERNLLRRRINGWLLQNITRIYPGTDIVIIVRGGATRLSRQSLYSAIEKLFKKTSIL